MEDCCRGKANLALRRPLRRYASRSLCTCRENSIKPDIATRRSPPTIKGVRNAIVAARRKPARRGFSERFIRCRRGPLTRSSTVAAFFSQCCCQHHITLHPYFFWAPARPTTHKCNTYKFTDLKSRHPMIHSFVLSTARSPFSSRKDIYTQKSHAQSRGRCPHHRQSLLEFQLGARKNKRQYVYLVYILFRTLQHDIDISA